MLERVVQRLVKLFELGEGEQQGLGGQVANRVNKSGCAGDAALVDVFT